MNWSPSRRTVLAVGAVTAVVLVALVLVGRWERTRQIDRQLRGFREVQALIGRLDSPSLAGFRVLPTFDCLTYRRNGNPYALELCVDANGHVVGAADRREPHRQFWSLADEPSASSDRIDRAEVDRLLRKMGAIRSSTS